MGWETDRKSTAHLHDTLPAAALGEVVTDIPRDMDRAGTALDRIRGFVRRRPAQRNRLAIDALVTEVVAMVHTSLTARGIATEVTIADGQAPPHLHRPQARRSHAPGLGAAGG